MKQLLAGDRREAAADVLRLAGRHEEAIELYLACGLHHGAGASLRALGRHDEAICHLTLTPQDGPHYREACREVAAASIARESLEPFVARFILPFADSGPRSDQEVPAFLDLAELYWAAGDRRRADRCLTLVLRLVPRHETAQLLRLTWRTEQEREKRG